MSHIVYTRVLFHDEFLDDWSTTEPETSFGSTRTQAGELARTCLGSTESPTSARIGSTAPAPANQLTPEHSHK